MVKNKRIKHERNPKCSCFNCKYHNFGRCELRIVLFIDGICINKKLLPQKLVSVEKVVGGEIYVS